ncbi:MAG: metal-sensitive transcriptional regulator [Candidatus Nitrosotenuis sp.]|nr:MAG: metal-sensitive transcriptional regulator [Candidatus Nitrosotenuis sp.]TBR12156.1 MAG: metal-sensitive transcriptional regulator [Candidatus Nitrosotenuis sp.]
MTHHKLPEVARRLARIEGHVKGIRKMIDEGKSYPEIVQQITAVRAALDGAMGVIIDDLVEGVSQSPHGKRKQAATELKDTVSKIL